MRRGARFAWRYAHRWWRRPWPGRVQRHSPRLPPTREPETTATPPEFPRRRSWPDGSVPVLFVHGLDSSPAIWDEGPDPITRQVAALKGVTAWTYDYSKVAVQWVTDPQIGLGLAGAITCLAQATGKQVIVVAHSMVGLATEWAVNQVGTDGVPVANHVAKVITIGTPTKGSLSAPSPWNARRGSRTLSLRWAARRVRHWSRAWKLRVRPALRRSSRTRRRTSAGGLVLTRPQRARRCCTAHQSLLPCRPGLRVCPWWPWRATSVRRCPSAVSATATSRSGISLCRSTRPRPTTHPAHRWSLPAQTPVLWALSYITTTNSAITTTCRAIRRSRPRSSRRSSRPCRPPSLSQASTRTRTPRQSSARMACSLWFEHRRAAEQRRTRRAQPATGKLQTSS